MWITQPFFSILQKISSNWIGLNSYDQSLKTLKFMPDPTPGLDSIIADITAMNNAFVQPACQMDQEPMIKYPSTGTPPTLSFNIPQSTVFNTYGKMAVPLGSLVASPNIDSDLINFFKPFCFEVPENNY
jgi:hypothetical protein